MPHAFITIAIPFNAEFVGETAETVKRIGNPFGATFRAGGQLLFYSNYGGSWESYLRISLPRLMLGSPACGATQSAFHAPAFSFWMAPPMETASRDGRAASSIPHLHGTAPTRT